MEFWKTRPPKLKDAFRMYPSRYYILAGMNVLAWGIITSHCTRMTEQAKKIVHPVVTVTGLALTAVGITKMIKGK